MARTTAPHGTPPFDVDALAHAIADDGVDRHRQPVAQLVAAALDAGAPTPLIGALTDPTVPEVVRQRAFARLASALDQRPSPTPGLTLLDDGHTADTGLALV